MNRQTVDQALAAVVRDQHNADQITLLGLDTDNGLDAACELPLKGLARIATLGPDVQSRRLPQRYNTRVVMSIQPAGWF
jgi:hypothetical protein